MLPVLVVGVAAAALTAVASSRSLAEPSWSTSGVVTPIGPPGQVTLPLATTLSMVVLAAWGVVLVTRGRVRRAVAVLGVLAALGVLATVVWAWWGVPDALLADLRALDDEAGTEFTAWYWLALLGAVVSLAATVAAVRWVGSWPEMGTRYDSPTGRAAADADDDLALWKALDEGRDPTA